MHVTRPRTRKQVPPRSISVAARVNDTLLLQIFDGRSAEPTFYFCSPIPSDWGRAFRLERQGEQDTDEVYDVLLDDRKSTCTCKGFQFYDRPCKHVLGLLALAAREQLPEAQHQYHTHEDVCLPRCPACNCRSAEEHQTLCLDPFDDAA